MHVGPSKETSHLYKGKEDVNKPKKQKTKKKRNQTMVYIVK